MKLFRIAMLMMILCCVWLTSKDIEASAQGSPPYPQTITYPSRAAASAACEGDKAWAIAYFNFPPPNPVSGYIVTGQSCYEVPANSQENAYTVQTTWFFVPNSQQIANYLTLNVLSLYYFKVHWCGEPSLPGGVACDFFSHPKSMGCPCNNKNGPNFAGDPINIATGNEYQAEEDFARGDLSYVRYYNSDTSVRSSHMGTAWLNSFDRSITISNTSLNGTVPSPNQVTVTRPDGQELSFSKLNGVWVSDKDVPTSLVETDNSNGTVASWLYFDANIRRYEAYSATGVLLSISDESRTLVTLAYTDGSQASDSGTALPPALLWKATDGYGRSLTFGYDNQFRISSATQPDGGIIRYGYNANNMISSITFPDQSVRKYVYDESAYSAAGSNAGKLTGILDEANSRFATYGYQADGRAISSSRAGGAELLSVHYGNAGVTTVTYPLGQSTITNFSAPLGTAHLDTVSGLCGENCGQNYRSQTLDANGYPAATTDFNNNVSSTTYSPSGLLSQKIEAEGQVTQRTTNFTWDATLRVPLNRSVLDNNGNTVAYDAWVYNTFGQATARCKADPKVSGATSYICGGSSNAPPGVRQWRYAYCTVVNTTQCPLVGLLLSIDGPRTDVSDITNYSYYLSTDESGCGADGGACHRAGDLYQVTNALGQITTFAAYDKNGRVARQLDGNGVITDNVYNARGWLTSLTVGGATTGFTYMPYGAVASITDADGVVVNYTYDAAHRLTDITDAVGDHIHYTLDAAGNKTQEQVYDPSGIVRKALSRTYNTLGQLTQVTDGLSNAVFKANFPDSYDGNGNLVHSSDANSIERKMGYDGLNRLQSTIDNYNGTDTATQNTQSVFSMDANDRLEGVSDPNGLTTTYGYDGLGNATSIQSPDTGNAANQYDAAGNLTQHTDARSVVTQYVYDALNRRTRVIYPAHPALNITYTYDQASPIAGCPSNFNVGRLTTMTDASGSTAWCYTNQGDIREVKQVINGVTYLHGYAYTAARRLKYLQYPSGFELIYGYDAAGRANSIGYQQQPGPYGSYTNSTVTPLITNVTYFPFGGATSYTWAQGNQSVSRTYDGNGEVSDMTSGALNLHFRRDAMGNIAAEGTMPGANPATESYQYDPLYRLTELDDGTGAKEQSFTYNKTGDRLSATTGSQPAVNYTYQAGTHFLSNVGGLARVPDNNGNTMAMTAPNGLLVGLGYDDRNLLTAVTNAGSTIANYQYNGLGYRVWRTITSPSTGQMAAVYDPAGTGNLYGEYFATDFREYVYLNGIPVASATDSGRVAPIMNYLHADHLGTLRGVTDTSGNVVYSWAWQDDAFGDQLKSGAANFYTRFPGQYYDVETGLHYNVNRYYEPSTGRYAQRDPLGLNAGPNLYAYVGSNPLTHWDSNGLADLFYWKGYNGDWGHVGLRLDDGTYISWFPVDYNHEFPLGNGFFSDYFSANARPDHEPGDDSDLEGHQPNSMIHIDGLDEGAIRDWWNKFKTSHRWNSAFQNCSTTVAEALMAGGTAKTMPGYPSNTIWSPENVVDYVNAYNEAQTNPSAHLWMTR